MINRLIDWCLRNRFLVIAFYVGVTGWGIVSMIGGMVSSLLHILIVTPVIFLLLREWDRRRGRLKETIN